MSKEYKEKIEKLVQQADSGNTQAAKEILEEVDKWKEKVDKLKKEGG